MARPGELGGERLGLAIVEQLAAVSGAVASLTSKTGGTSLGQDQLAGAVGLGACVRFRAAGSP